MATFSPRFIPTPAQLAFMARIEKAQKENAKNPAKFNRELRAHKAQIRKNGTREELKY